MRPGDVAARLGGDEFAVLLEDVDDPTASRSPAGMLDLLAEPVTSTASAVWVHGSSVGIATARRRLGRRRTS